MENLGKQECCTCGVLFYVSKTLKENWENTQKLFFCPNGHSQSYIRSTADILRDELSQKQKKIELLSKEIEEKSVSLYNLQRKLKCKKK